MILVITTSTDAVGTQYIEIDVDRTLTTNLTIIGWEWTSEDCQWLTYRWNSDTERWHQL